MAKEDKIWTIIELVNWGTTFFGKKGIDSPRLTLELMLCHILSCSRIQLYTNFEQPLKLDELEVLRNFVNRRVAREPLQYILGTTRFLDFDFIVDSNTLIPRPETELLTNFVIQNEINREPKSILDIGTGSGCIAISLASKFPESRIVAIDISEKALVVARKNTESLIVQNIDFMKIDILNELPAMKFDLIVSNPPYIPIEEFKELEPEVIKFEPETALTDKTDGLTFYRRFASIFSDLLAPDGSFYLEIGWNQGQAVKTIFSENKYEVKLSKDFSDLDRIAYFKMTDKN